ncbi:MAG: hypothetical protein KME28_18940 [Pelatocladus maniniholoensis HA4357-MV3]|jgi:hypothetical protein|uniref:Uncharacterized protein n=1 Tax=Pelatocladus maniniholoensis HA4357-MV3 TaxID=1117104 RepID=A0A9E3HBM3_9NOST|nr:hypothetical protein [Pelatocladus maniniholoensis HA4357-MV3]BAZ68762.1 hypothetical protein NIES4106_35280 [Fischerella sp. NIES-4106]
MSYSKSLKNYKLWFERVMAIIATINLCLVLFNLSYISWRDRYLQYAPRIVIAYDPLKGIEPHRETEKYLDTIDELKNQVSKTGLQSLEVKNKLADLRRLSVEMIGNNPFASANKSGTLEKIKNKMRTHLKQESAKIAFEIFWSQEYLLQNGWTKEIMFFNQQVRPLIATNYYRSIGENGEYFDYFWLIDLPFVWIFAVELLLRSYYIKRRYPRFSWLNAILWRWYDLFLLIPFWRWLRVIPVMIRLDQAEILNLQPIRQQMHLGVVSNFAEDLTEIVVVRVINQVQGSIHRGELFSWFLQKENLRPYIDINNVNEVEAIAAILVQTIVYQVLPTIQPELVAILHHNLENALNNSPVYRNLQNLPGVAKIQTQLSEQLATQITTNLYNALVSTVEDPVAAKLSSQLLQRFREALGEQIQQKHILSELQGLLVDFLEEIKLNYVERLSQEDFNKILEQTTRLKNGQENK